MTRVIGLPLNVKIKISDHFRSFLMKNMLFIRLKKQTFSLLSTKTSIIYEGTNPRLKYVLSNDWIESRKYNQKGGLKVQTLFPVATFLASSETYCKFKNCKPHVQIHILVIKPNVGKLKWGCKSRKCFFQNKKYFLLKYPKLVTVTK